MMRVQFKDGPTDAGRPRIRLGRRRFDNNDTGNRNQGQGGNRRGVIRRRRYNNF
jgi:hypothetical protein